MASDLNRQLPGDPEDILALKIVSENRINGSHIEPDESIPEKAGRIAFEQLRLTAEDVLLDVGTGAGEGAIAAARVCSKVIGVDIDRRKLEQARTKAEQEGLENFVFAYGSFEKPSAETDLTGYNITRILAVYSLHHLTDPEKKRSLAALVSLLRRPGRIVIGDLIFFDDPENHRADFDKVAYDDGETDFPSSVEYLVECLEQLGAKVTAEQIHALVGVILAELP